jgi:hypothetical protein
MAQDWYWYYLSDGMWTGLFWIIIGYVVSMFLVLVAIELLNGEAARTSRQLRRDRKRSSKRELQK